MTMTFVCETPKNGLIWKGGHGLKDDGKHTGTKNPDKGNDKGDVITKQQR
jgi:hypothetical protein